MSREEPVGTRSVKVEDISCAITHFGASVQSNYPEYPI
jgi:hypothetical protein